MRYQKLLFGASVFSAAIALNNCRHCQNMRPEMPIFQLELSRVQRRPLRPASITPIPILTRPTKITFAEMREVGVRGLLVYCQDFHCSHSLAISGDPWPDDVRLADLAIPRLKKVARLFFFGFWSSNRIGRGREPRKIEFSL